jgi:CDP-glucose 4,6-dehydratase
VEDVVTNAGVYWNGRRVLLTGHTGFKGAWLALLLQRAGAHVTGVSLAPHTTPSLYVEARIGAMLESHLLDLRDIGALQRVFQQTKPHVVFHLAAQALVRTSYLDPLATLATNIMGTAHVLECARQAAPTLRAVVVATTDKVYAQDGRGEPFREDDRLGGHDPYSASKAASEIVIDSYRQSYLDPCGVRVASVRAGNVIGGGDWSQDRLIPDVVRALQAATPLELRNPHAVRPWQHVLEPLTAYMTLARRLASDEPMDGAYNIGPRTGDTALTVSEVVGLAHTALGDARAIRVVSPQHAGLHEAHALRLDATKAEQTFGFRPRWRTQDAVQRTMHWYRDHATGLDPYQLCLRDIEAYEACEASA